MELWDLYDKDRHRTGKIHVRGEELPEELYHLVIHAWIRNGSNEYLIAQRRASRPTFPLMWECVGGSVLAGESSLEGALREIQEEVGLSLPPDSGICVDSVRRTVISEKKFNDILDIWLFRYDGEVTLENATTDEVAGVKWMTPPQIQQLLDTGKLVDTLSYFFTKIAPYKGNFT